MPDEVATRRELKRLLDPQDDQGRNVGSAKRGVNAFYDYDGGTNLCRPNAGTPGGRIGWHLTGARCGAAAKSVLDPLEVAEVELWPLWDIARREANDPDVKGRVNAAEWTVYPRVSVCRCSASHSRHLAWVRRTERGPDGPRSSRSLMARARFAMVRARRATLLSTSLRRSHTSGGMMHPRIDSGSSIVSTSKMGPSLRTAPNFESAKVHLAYPGRADVAQGDDYQD